MNKQTKQWLKKIRENANPHHIRITYPGKWDEHTPGRLVAVGEMERRRRD